jgi:hypothetical protein
MDNGDTLLRSALRDYVPGASREPSKKMNANSMPSANRCAATASRVSASAAADARRATIPIAVSSDHADVSL